MTVAELRALLDESSSRNDEWLGDAAQIADFIWGKPELRTRIYGMVRKNTDAPLIKLNNGPITARKSAIVAWILEKEKRKTK
ncbi:hypothetical protein HNR60_003285 [Rhodopseudomonas rhenobacensis]|uniref:DNA-binding protein n=1 Tax=Rhodopseudomonas rhenobacensis TaxID=87461 RepID=A0A7W7Z5R5_9BRAD|nr:hypothetical protein [Rhodopseudomonas rhenobacensis]MBB5048518.1 hypothetical protein [Rhodopseudomonas rhenobacensis]